MSNDTDNNCQTQDSQWDNAIRDAENEIRELDRRRARLRQAIRIFQANKADKVNWPKAGSEGSSCAGS